MKNLKRGDTFIKVTTKSNLHKDVEEKLYTPKVCLVSSSGVPLPEYGTLEADEGSVRAVKDSFMLLEGSHPDSLAYSTLEEAQDTIDRWLEQEALGDLYTKKTTSHIEYPQGEDK